jgi:hypothetical protein
MNVNEPLGEHLDAFVQPFDERSGQTDERSVLFRDRFYSRSEAAALARSATGSKSSSPM